jgi:hypothetical protein
MLIQNYFAKENKLDFIFIEQLIAVSIKPISISWDSYTNQGAG